MGTKIIEMAAAESEEEEVESKEVRLNKSVDHQAVRPRKQTR